MILDSGVRYGFNFIFLQIVPAPFIKKSDHFKIGVFVLNGYTHTHIHTHTHTPESKK